MESKLFELRDTGTFLPVIAIRLEPTNVEDRYLLAITGYGLKIESQRKYILMGKLSTANLKCSPNEHEGYPTVRTLPMAHQHILKHWEELKSGDVIDVEFILGETKEPKVSQRLEQC